MRESPSGFVECDRWELLKVKGSPEPIRLRSGLSPELYRRTELVEGRPLGVIKGVPCEVGKYVRYKVY
jgi:hypothetical protein